MLPRQLPYGDLEVVPLEDDISPDKRTLSGGYMVVTPPRVVVNAAIKAGQAVTSRRIAMIEAGPYLHKQEAEAYAHAIAALPELIRACQAALTPKEYVPFVVKEMAEKALTKAGILV